MLKTFSEENLYVAFSTQESTQKIENDLVNMFCTQNYYSFFLLGFHQCILEKRKIFMKEMWQHILAAVCAMCNRNRGWEMLVTERLPCFSQRCVILNECSQKGATHKEEVCRLYGKPNVMHFISGTPSSLCQEIAVAFK